MADIRPDTSAPTDYAAQSAEAPQMSPWEQILQMFHSQYPNAPEEYKTAATRLAEAMGNLHQDPNAPDQMAQSSPAMYQSFLHDLAVVAAASAPTEGAQQTPRPRMTGGPGSQGKGTAKPPGGEQARPAPSKSGPEKM